jgi:predicted nucleic-acid-binding protein
LKIGVDTNILVRAITEDDAVQGVLAQAELARAETVAIAAAALCEFAWVLGRGYRTPARDIAVAIRRLIGATSVAVDRSAIEAGLATLDAGGDFADGVIAHEGRWLGAEAFVSFDRQAVELVRSQGHAARLPAG